MYTPRMALDWQAIFGKGSPASGPLSIPAKLLRWPVSQIDRLLSIAGPLHSTTASIIPNRPEWVAKIESGHSNLKRVRNDSERFAW